jgi:hypothetical protein
MENVKIASRWKPPRKLSTSTERSEFVIAVSKYRDMGSAEFIFQEGEKIMRKTTAEQRAARAEWARNWRRDNPEWREYMRLFMIRMRKDPKKKKKYYEYQAAYKRKLRRQHPEIEKEYQQRYYEKKGVNNINARRREIYRLKKEGKWSEKCYLPKGPPRGVLKGPMKRRKQKCK